MHDPVNNPRHYTAYEGLEVIDLTEQLNFNRGNAVKYIARAGLKDPEREIQDLQKAAWYIEREIQRLDRCETRRQKFLAEWEKELLAADHVVPDRTEHPVFRSGVQEPPAEGDWQLNPAEAHD